MFNSCISAFLRDSKSATKSASGESAVDSQTVPRHKRRSVRTQPQNGLGYFLDATEATDGMESSEIILFHIQAIG